MLLLGLQCVPSCPVYVVAGTEPRASCMLGKHSVSSAISPAPACGSLKGGRQTEVFLRLVTDMPQLSICTPHIIHPIAFTYQSTGTPFSLLQEISAMAGTAERSKKSKARAVLRGFAVIFYLLPGTLSSLSQAVLARMWALFSFVVHCSDINRRGWVPCHLMVLSQHSSVTPGTFVLDHWLVCKVIEKSGGNGVFILLTYVVNSGVI